MIFLRESVVQIFLLICVITKMNNNGLVTLPYISNRCLPDPNTGLPLGFSYVSSTILNSASGAPIHHRVAIVISIGTLS